MLSLGRKSQGVQTEGPVIWKGRQGYPGARSLFPLPGAWGLHPGDLSGLALLLSCLSTCLPQDLCFMSSFATNLLCKILGPHFSLEQNS